MREPIRNFYGPRTNDWEKGKKYRPLNPDGFDPLPTSHVPKELVESMKRQSTDGSWDWYALPRPRDMFQEYSYLILKAVTRDICPAAFGSADCYEVRSTIGVAVAVSRSYTQWSLHSEPHLAKARQFIEKVCSVGEKTILQAETLVSIEAKSRLLAKLKK